MEQQREVEDGDFAAPKSKGSTQLITVGARTSTTASAPLLLLLLLLYVYNSRHV